MAGCRRGVRSAQDFHRSERCRYSTTTRFRLNRPPTTTPCQTRIPVRMKSRYLITIRLPKTERKTNAACKTRRIRSRSKDESSRQARRGSRPASTAFWWRLQAFLQRMRRTAFRAREGVSQMGLPAPGTHAARRRARNQRAVARASATAFNAADSMSSCCCPDTIIVGRPQARTAASRLRNAVSSSLYG